MRETMSTMQGWNHTQKSKESFCSLVKNHTVVQVQDYTKNISQGVMSPGLTQQTAVKTPEKQQRRYSNVDLKSTHTAYSFQTPEKIARRT